MFGKKKNNAYAGAHNTDALYVSGIERKLDSNKTIVSKTDVPGTILYANDVFIEISGFTEEELLGQPHSIVRHPDMPRCVFKLLWDTVAKGEEIFAYVVNRCKNGDHYWVFAHVTPCYNLQGKLIGYHSSRRAPKDSAIKTIEPIYRQLLNIEKQHGRKEGLAASEQALFDLLAKNKVTYPEFVFSL